MTNKKQTNEMLNEGDIVRLVVPKIKIFIERWDCQNCIYNCTVGDYIFPSDTLGIIINRYVHKIKGELFEVFLFKPCKISDGIVEAASNQLEKIGTCMVSIDNSESCEVCNLRDQCFINNWRLPRRVEVGEYV